SPMQQRVTLDRAWQGSAEQLGKMYRGAVGMLQQLCAATEAVRHHERVGIGLPNGWQHTILRTGCRDIIVTLFEAEVTGDAAASGVQGGVVDACRRHESF